MRVPGVESRRGYLTPGAGVASGCEALHGSWELNLDLPQEQLAILTAGPLLQPLVFQL